MAEARVDVTEELLKRLLDTLGVITALEGQVGVVNDAGQFVPLNKFNLGRQIEVYLGDLLNVLADSVFKGMGLDVDSLTGPQVFNYRTLRETFLRSLTRALVEELVSRADVSEPTSVAQLLTTQDLKATLVKVLEQPEVRDILATAFPEIASPEAVRKLKQAQEAARRQAERRFILYGDDWKRFFPKGFPTTGPELAQTIRWLLVTQVLPRGRRYYTPWDVAELVVRLFSGLTPENLLELSALYSDMPYYELVKVRAGEAIPELWKTWQSILEDIRTKILSNPAYAQQIVEEGVLPITPTEIIERFLQAYQRVADAKKLPKLTKYGVVKSISEEVGVPIDRLYPQPDYSRMFAEGIANLVIMRTLWPSLFIPPRREDALALGIPYQLSDQWARSARRVWEARLWAVLGPVLMFRWDGNESRARAEFKRIVDEALRTGDALRAFALVEGPQTNWGYVLSKLLRVEHPGREQWRRPRIYDVRLDWTKVEGAALGELEGSGTQARAVPMPEERPLPR